MSIMGSHDRDGLFTEAAALVPHHYRRNKGWRGIQQAIILSLRPLAGEEDCSPQAVQQSLRPIPQHQHAQTNQIQTQQTPLKTCLLREALPPQPVMLINHAYMMTANQICKWPELQSATLEHSHQLLD